MVGSFVHRASQVNHSAPGRLGNSVGRLAAPMAVGNGDAAPSSSGKPSEYAGVWAWAHSNQNGSLVQCHVLREQAVENLKSRLFFGLQCHILHEVSVIFMLAS